MYFNKYFCLFCSLLCLMLVSVGHVSLIIESVRFLPDLTMNPKLFRNKNSLRASWIFYAWGISLECNLFITQQVLKKTSQSSLFALGILWLTRFQSVCTEVCACSHGSASTHWINATAANILSLEKHAAGTATWRGIFLRCKKCRPADTPNMSVKFVCVWAKEKMWATSTHRLNSDEVPFNREGKFETRFQWHKAARD